MSTRARVGTPQNPPLDPPIWPKMAIFGGLRRVDLQGIVTETGVAENFFFEKSPKSPFFASRKKAIFSRFFRFAKNPKNGGSRNPYVLKPVFWAFSDFSKTPFLAEAAGCLKNPEKPTTQNGHFWGFRG